MFNIANTIILLVSKSICINNIGPSYFTVASMWPKSYHDTGPQGTFLRHRTLSKTLVRVGACVRVRVCVCVHVCVCVCLCVVLSMHTCVLYILHYRRR